MPNIRGPELLILVLVIVLLFGAKRLPDVARGLGRSLRIFKAETQGLVESDEGEHVQQRADSGSPAAGAQSRSAGPAAAAHPAPPDGAAHDGSSRADDEAVDR